MSWNLPKAVSCAVMRLNQVLLIRREKEPHVGKWTLPGGRVKVNESIEQAMMREAEEQTGYILHRRISELVPLIQTKEGKWEVTRPGGQLSWPLMTAAWSFYAQLPPKERNIETMWLTPEQMAMMDESLFTPGLREVLQGIIISIPIRR